MHGRKNKKMIFYLLIKYQEMNDSDKFKQEEIFGHNRESNIKLSSTVLVENVLLENKDIFAIGTLWEDLKDFFNHYNEQYQYSLQASDLLDQRRVAYTFCTNIDDRKKEPSGFHLGDCTSFAMSCSRCIAESIYIEGLTLLDEFNTFLNEKGIICLEPSIKLLAILFCTEHLWCQYNSLADVALRPMNQHHKEPPCSITNYVELNNKRNELWDNLWSWQFHYDFWYNSSLEMKELCHKRALRFLNYFDNRPTVKGIPWW